jgi:hypothetical protein
MAGVVVALARWPARWKSSETGSAHTAKGAARVLNAASSEPRSMPSSAREKPRGVRQNDGRGGAGRGRRLERRLCDGGAGPQRGKRSMISTFQGLLWLVGEASRQGGREGEGSSFISFCPAYALASAACTPNLMI